MLKRIKDTREGSRKKEGRTQGRKNHERKVEEYMKGKTRIEGWRLGMKERRIKGKKKEKRRRGENIREKSVEIQFHIDITICIE